MRGYFGIGVYMLKSAVNLGTLWRSANILGAKYIFTIGRRYNKQSSDTMQTQRHIPLITYIDFEDFYNQLITRMTQDFKDGLALLKEKTMQKRFFISKESLLDPVTFINKQIQDELSPI